MKCPYCGSTYYCRDCDESYPTTNCYSPVWKDRVNVSPNRNRTTIKYKCLLCGKEFIVSDAFEAIGNQNDASRENYVVGTGEHTKNESVALGVVGVKDTNSIIIKSDKLLIKGDCFETTVDLDPDKLKRFKKIIINDIVFVKE